MPHLIIITRNIHYRSFPFVPFRPFIKCCTRSANGFLVDLSSGPLPWMAISLNLDKSYDSTKQEYLMILFWVVKENMFRCSFNINSCITIVTLSFLYPFCKTYDIIMENSTRWVQVAELAVLYLDRKALVSSIKTVGGRTRRCTNEERRQQR